jgi:protein O-mannosyl-transferase
MAKKLRTVSVRTEAHTSKVVAIPPAEKQDSSSGKALSKFGEALTRHRYSLIPPALGLLATVNTLWNDYASDDTLQVLKNLFIRDLRNLPLAFTSSVWSFVGVDIAMTAQSYYRPLFSVLFVINYALFGTAPWGWHLVNVLVHVMVTFLVFIVCRELTGRGRLSSIAAALFAVHPVHAESIAWVSGVTDPLMSVFLLLSFYFYLRHRATHRRYFLALMAALYFFALLSKESAIALPVFVVYCEMFYFSESDALAKRFSRAALLSALFALPTLAYMAMRYQSLGTSLAATDDRYPLGPALLTIPLATVKYLVLMAAPVRYSYQHFTLPITSVTSAGFIWPAAVVTILTLAIVLSKSSLLKLSTVWFILMLSPALLAMKHFDPPYLIQERYLYLAAMGACLAAALGIERLATVEVLRRYRRSAATATAVLVLVFGSVHIAQNLVWKDTITLFRHCVSVDPDSEETHLSLCGYYYSEGRPREAEAEARIGLRLNPHNPSGYSSLSFFSKEAGRLDQSIDYLEQAVQEAPINPITRMNMATVHLNLGLLYAQRKEFQRAEDHLILSTQLWDRAVGWYYVGEFYFAQTRYEEARQMYERALSRVPSKYAPIHLKIGLSWEALGQADKARAEYETYLDYAPAAAPERKVVSQRITQRSGESKAK